MNIAGQYLSRGKWSAFDLRSYGKIDGQTGATYSGIRGRAMYQRRQADVTEVAENDGYRWRDIAPDPRCRKYKKQNARNDSGQSGTNREIEGGEKLE